MRARRRPWQVAASHACGTTTRRRYPRSTTPAARSTICCRRRGTSSMRPRRRRALYAVTRSYRAGRRARGWAAAAAATAAARCHERLASRRMSVDADRQELRMLQHHWMRAVQERDMDTLEQLVGDGFRFTAIHLHPEPMSRRQWLDAARDGFAIVTFAYEDMEVEVFGDTGVVHSRYPQIATFAAGSLSTLFRPTDVWTRSGGRWQAVARHASVYG